jgi:hypothetical protein
METMHIVACRLVLERCQICLSHVHALLHLSGHDDPEKLVSGNMRTVLASLEQELRNGMELLNSAI